MVNKKKLLTRSAGVIALGLSFGLSLGIFARFTQKPIEQTYAAEGTYYSSIKDNLSGTDLLNALNVLNTSKRKRTIKYDGMKTFAAKCDVNPNGGNKIVGFYDNKLIGPSWDGGSSWNREHVWPNVRGGNKVEDDAHMVRPASTSTNSDRGSKGFGTASYDPGKYVAYYRGVSARIIFYCAIADTSLKLIENPLNYNGGGPADSMGCLSNMLKWNLEYLPTGNFTGADDLARDTELSRNEKIQNLSDGQGNRNPFIDHPEYACRIWGDTNDKTKEVCKNNITPSTDSGNQDQGGEEWVLLIEPWQLALIIVGGVLVLGAIVTVVVIVVVRKKKKRIS